METILLEQWLCFPPHLVNTSIKLLLTATNSNTSGGSVTVRSSSVFDDPQIDPGFFSSEFDVQATVEATQSLLRFFDLPAWKGYILSPANNSLQDTSEAGIRSYMQTWGTTYRHPVGTATMSKTDQTEGVVTPDLMLKKASGVRIVDASIFVSRCIIFVTGILTSHHNSHLRYRLILRQLFMSLRSVPLTL